MRRTPCRTRRTAARTLYTQVTHASPVTEALDAHLAALTAAGAASPQVLVPGRTDDIAALDALEHVTLPGPFREYLERVGGYDYAACHALRAPEPDFAEGFFAISAAHIPRHYANAGILLSDDGDDGYWPLGYVPFLWGGSGDYLLIDCRPQSPTYGAVYGLDEAEGVGGEPRFPDLVALLRAASAELAEGRRVFETPTHSRLTTRWSR